MHPDRDSLLASVSVPTAQGAIEDTRALIQRAHSLEKVREWLRVFDPLLPADAEEPLVEYLRFALLGLCLGFVERDLSPYHGEHLAIVPAMLADIRTVFEKLLAMGQPVEADVFRHRCFDYGVHKAYYLDWTLYMSKECY